MTCLKISVDLNLNVDKILEEFNQLAIERFISHPGNPLDWSVIPLHNSNGSAKNINLNKHLKRIKTGMSMVPCKPTEYLEKMPYLKSILQSLPTQVFLVRILKLKAKGNIPQHRDSSCFNFQDGSLLRLHLPLDTCSQAIMYIKNIPYCLEKGILYATDVSLPHSAINNSDNDRIHIVIDVEANHSIREWFKL